MLGRKQGIQQLGVSSVSPLWCVSLKGLREKKLQWKKEKLEQQEKQRQKIDEQVRNKKKDGQRL